MENDKQLTPFEFHKNMLDLHFNNLNWIYDIYNEFKNGPDYNIDLEKNEYNVYQDPNIKNCVILTYSCPGLSFMSSQDSKSKEETALCSIADEKDDTISEIFKNNNIWLYGNSSMCVSGYAGTSKESTFISTNPVSCTFYNPNSKITYKQSVI
jgi:hypothetical protein